MFSDIKNINLWQMDQDDEKLLSDNIISSSYYSLPSTHENIKIHKHDIRIPPLLIEIYFPNVLANIIYEYTHENITFNIKRMHCYHNYELEVCIHSKSWPHYNIEINRYDGCLKINKMDIESILKTKIIHVPLKNNDSNNDSDKKQILNTNLYNKICEDEIICFMNYFIKQICNDEDHIDFETNLDYELKYDDYIIDYYTDFVTKDKYMVHITNTNESNTYLQNNFVTHEIRYINEFINLIIIIKIMMKLLTTALNKKINKK